MSCKEINMCQTSHKGVKDTFYVVDLDVLKLLCKPPNQQVFQLSLIEVFLVFLAGTMSATVVK